MSQKAPNDTDKFIGTRIKLRRTALGMSQEKLGEILGITFQQIQKYEKGINRVGAGRLQEIADVLNVPVTFFFMNPDNPSGAGSQASELQAFLTSREGVELAEAFMRVDNPAIRRAIIDMAKAAAS